MNLLHDSKESIETLLRQGAGLITLQKYFDQWDTALKQLGKLEQKIVQANWSASKISRITGKPPNIEFQLKTFSKYDVTVIEGVYTAVQQQNEFLQALHLNQQIGGIIPAKYLLEKSPIQGKKEIIEAIEEQQKAAQEMQKQEMLIKQALLEAEIQNLQSQSVSNVATARERHGRAESNIGLFEERLSEITQNRSMALKNKVESLAKLIEIFQGKLTLSDHTFRKNLCHDISTCPLKKMLDKSENGYQPV